MAYLCGCYYTLPSDDYYIRFNKNYLPLLDSSAHSTILATTSKTVLKQTFTNPSTTGAIKECIYTFPLYDGVSVVSFTCRIGKKVLTGVVKEKHKAKKIFDEAVAKGETAGLLEQAPESADVFSTKLGNIPAGQSIVVEITYIGELKHTETEGIRFTIPTSIAPRYGSGPAATSNYQLNADQGIKITVDVNMPEGSFIKGVQSPSHPIAVAMGTISTAINADPSMSRASATLSLGSSALEKDFILIVSAKDVGIPKALLEIHPTIPNHRALMATLVPKFSLPPSRPEIVFVADRSGSMAGGPITMLISAMGVLLKSMPLGVKFNICSFGSQNTFLWSKSKPYTAETLAEASTHVDRFTANMGGTETYAAIKSTIDRRFTDIPLEIILLTDGDIWSQEALFEYVNTKVAETNGNIRVFPLGIGNGVSHSLIEGLARAGNGFASAVQNGERLDTSVVRMLRGALSPHITDYTLEVKYEKNDDDFEVVEKVTEGMRVLLSDSAKPEPPKATISLFDTSVNPEKDDIKNTDSPYAHLPDIPYPHLYQAPHNIPSLFAFSRASVYLLLSPETIQRNPTSVVLRATSTHGPLALEIPIEVLSEPGTTIHQLAAKKAVQDLEEGRGWIFDVKDQNGKLIKERYESCFHELVEKEAVRLGEKFQIAGKWTSFVAVSSKAKPQKGEEVKETEREVQKEDDEKSGENLKQNANARYQALDIDAEVDEASDDDEDYADAGYRRYVQNFPVQSCYKDPAYSLQKVSKETNNKIPYESKSSTRSRSRKASAHTIKGGSAQKFDLPDSSRSESKYARISPVLDCAMSGEIFPSIEAFGGQLVFEPTSPGYSPTSPFASSDTEIFLQHDLKYDIEKEVQYHEDRFEDGSDELVPLPSSPDYNPISPAASPNAEQPDLNYGFTEDGQYHEDRFDYGADEFITLSSKRESSPSDHSAKRRIISDSDSDVDMTNSNSANSKGSVPPGAPPKYDYAQQPLQALAKSSTRSRGPVNTMRESIEQGIVRGERHEGLVDKSQDLSASAQQFSASKKKKSSPFGSFFIGSSKSASASASSERSSRSGFLSGGRGGGVGAPAPSSSGPSVKAFAVSSAFGSSASNNAAPPASPQRPTGGLFRSFQSQQTPSNKLSDAGPVAQAPLLSYGAPLLSHGGGGAPSSYPQSSESLSYDPTIEDASPRPPPPPQGGFPSEEKKSRRRSSKDAERGPSGSSQSKQNKTPTEKLLALISLQDFSGSWVSASSSSSNKLREISEILGFEIPAPPASMGKIDEKAWVTMVIIKVLEDKMPEEQGTWGLVVEKARGWLGGLGWTDFEKEMGALEKEAGEVVEKGWVGL